MNIKFEKNEVVVRIPFQPGGTYAPSKSGKTMMVASTGGFVMVPGTDGLKLSLNLTLPNKG